MIIILGASGSGKTTLAKVIEQLSNVKCEVINTQELIKLKKEQQIRLEDLKKELIFKPMELETLDKRTHRKKGKEIKPWQRTKFYQR